MLMTELEIQLAKADMCYKKGQVGKLPFLNVQMKTPLRPNENICSTCKLMKTAYLREF